MVQRKAPNKLGIQVDHDKSLKRLGSLGPSSPHHQDGKNRGIDLKKKMKKSRSIKRSDFESLRSASFRREVPQPGKPPPLHVPASSAAPQRQQPPAKASDASPNYMKPTSSFEARKERSQVSSRSLQTSVDSKSPRKISNNTKLSSGSGHKPARTLSRTSSLKLARTLTKSPSFKPARPSSARKCSQVVVCDDIDAQRATCSSTLKDSKFPTYLVLSPGATESEGASAMKVCPYTYCSLNGHRHAPLPSLKCFLRARRHMMKTQKSAKLSCLSPRRPIPSGDGVKEITEKVTHEKKHATIQELESNSPAIVPPIKEDKMDFFIEIYAGDAVAAAETAAGSKQNGDEQDDEPEVVATKDWMPSISVRTETEAAHDLPHSESGFEDYPDSSSGVIPTEIETPEEVYSSSSTPQEETPELPSYQSGLELESPSSTELDKMDSEFSTMDWEEGQYSALSPDEDVSYWDQTKNGYDFEKGFPFHDDNQILKHAEIISSYFDEIPADEGLEEFFSEEGASYRDWCTHGGSESYDSEASCQNLGSNGSNSASPTYDVSNESMKEKTNGNNPAIALATVYEPTEEPMEAREDEIKVFGGDDENLQGGDDKTESTFTIKDKGLLVHQENHCSVQDGEASAMLGKQECNNSFNFADLLQDEKDEVYNSSETKIEVHQSTAVREEEFVESLPPETEDPKTVRPELCNDDAEDSPGGGQEDAATVKDSESNLVFVVEDQNSPEKDFHQAPSFQTSGPMDFEDQTQKGLSKVGVVDNSTENIDEMEVESPTMSDAEESLPSSENAARTKAKAAFVRGGSCPSQELPNGPNNLRITRCQRPAEELEDPKKFNPREPNYLPIETDPDAEKVDLRHQMMDERKNAEDWMIDHALQQAVTKLAPARKRKVALMVEAFEKVMPIAKYESHLRSPSPAFAHARIIRACS